MREGVEAVVVVEESDQQRVEPEETARLGTWVWVQGEA